MHIRSLCRVNVFGFLVSRILSFGPIRPGRRARISMLWSDLWRDCTVMHLGQRLPALVVLRVVQHVQRRAMSRGMTRLSAGVTSKTAPRPCSSEHFIYGKPIWPVGATNRHAHQQRLAVAL